MKRIAVFGTGGFALQIASFLERMAADVRYFNDAGDGSFGGQPILPATKIDAADHLVVAVSSGAARRRICETLARDGDTIVAPSALISNGAVIGPGAVICDFAVIEAESTIGKQFHANVYAFVAHECRIGDFVTFGPRATCNGAVTIGDGVFIGADAVIRQGVSIGEGATVGMGAVVISDVPSGATVVGNPARVLRRDPSRRQP